VRLLFVPAFICWGAFLATWAAGFVYNLWKAPRIIRTASNSPTSGWPSWVVAAIAIYAVRRYVPPAAWARLTYYNRGLELAGVVILIAATLFTLWARWTLGTMWTGSPTIKEGHHLQLDGPYRLTRHPIYTGMIGMFLGSMLVTGFGGVLVAFVAFSVYLAFKIPTEERLLTETFGDRYRDYRRRVPALIPIKL